MRLKMPLFMHCRDAADRFVRAPARPTHITSACLPSRGADELGWAPAGRPQRELFGPFAGKLGAPAVVHCFTGTREEAEGFLKLGLHIGAPPARAEPEPLPHSVCAAAPPRAGWLALSDSARVRCTGFTGWLCDDREGRAEALGEAVKAVPLDRLLIETDAPYLVRARRIRSPTLSPRAGNMFRMKWSRSRWDCGVTAEYGCRRAQVPQSIKPSKARPKRNEPCLLPHVAAAVAQVKGAQSWCRP